MTAGRNRLFEFTAATITLLAFACAAEAQSRAVRFGRLWDGAKLINDAVVVVNGERIVSVGTGNAAVPAGTSVIDPTLVVIVA